MKPLNIVLWGHLGFALTGLSGELGEAGGLSTLLIKKVNFAGPMR